jgi:photosystem II stability/assembly factor-like uncharacterized protein
MKKVIFIILTLSIFSLSQAQWLQTNGPLGGSVNCLTNLNSYLFAGTDGGGIYTSTNNGQSWKYSSDGLISRTIYSFGISGTKIYAGTYNGLHVSLNYGFNWSQIYINGLQQQNIKALLILNNMIFAGSNAYGIFLSTNGGMNWSSVNDGLESNNIRAFCNIGTNIFVATVDGVYKSSDYGKNWININNNLINTNISSICSSGSVLLVGNPNGGASRTTNYGLNWIICNDSNFVYSVYALFSNGNYVLAGSNGYGVSKSTNNGVNWTRINNGLENKEVYAFTSSPTNLFCGTLGGIFCSTNYGSNWSAVNNGLNNLQINALCKSGNNIFSCAWRNFIFMSSNNGDSWLSKRGEIISEIVYSICSSGNYIFAGTAQGVHRSTNNGNNWTLATINGSGIGIALCMDSLTVLVGTQYGIYASTNNGINWISKNNGLSSNFINYLYKAGPTLFACGSSYFYLSTDHGNNWYIAYYGIQNSLPVTGMCYINGRYFAATANGGVFISTNNGTNWTLANNGIGNNIVLCMVLVDSNIIVGTRNGIFLTKNYGINWIQKNQGLIDMNIQSLIYSNNYIYAGTYTQSIWKRSYSDIVGIEKISNIVPSEYILYQNYPNPFNPNTNIKYQIKAESSSQKSEVRMIVYDVLGKEIATLVNEKQSPGTYEVSFDGSNFSSGIYFYKLETNDFSDTKRMILLK